jgi:multisubunit Na+/H+ antiporter MnhE subunit
MSTLKRLRSDQLPEATLPRIRLLIVVQVVWMILLVALLGWFGSVTPESFYIPAYVGLVVNAVLFAPVESKPRWWRTVAWIVRVGFLGLCYVIGVSVSEVTQL